MENKDLKDLQIFDDEKDKVKHLEFDGIKELKNPPPPWLMWIFYITIVFSAFYLVMYHVTKTLPLQDQEYVNELEKSSIKLNKNKESQKKESSEMKVLTDAASLAQGKEFFTKFTCVTCHGNSAEGNQIGPNLTDEYWIHGNTIEKIYDIIYNGNISKGMTPFKDQMSKDQMIIIASYILSLQGSNPPNAKAPQGDKY